MVRTPRVYCDGSTEFSQINIGEYSFDIYWQLVFVFFVLFLGFYFYFRYPKKKFSFIASRFSIFEFEFLESLVRFKYFSPLIRFIPALIFIVVLVTGFFGRDRASFAAPFVWMFWWTLLIFFVAFSGKIFCAFCPWDFFANLFQYGLVFNKKKYKAKKLLKWPKALKTVLPATVFFIIITWLELGLEITKSSYWTAVLGLIVVSMAVVIPMFFEKRAFCRYLCPVGRISGAYSLFAPLEIRVKEPTACLDCKTKDCVKGNEYSTACPTGLIPYKLQENTYCTLCTECIRSCEKNNLTINMRSMAADVDTMKKSNKDEGILYLIIFALTYFHGITMVDTWFEFIDMIRNSLNASYLLSFTILFAIYIVLFLFGVFIVNKVIEILSRKTISIFDLCISLIPVTLAYHLGHNIMHLLGELEFLIKPLNDPFGFGMNLFGLKDFVPKQGINHVDLLESQLVIYAIGLYYSVKTLRVRLQKLNISLDNKLAYSSSYFIVYSILFMLSFFSLWLISQPMVYRGGIL